MLKNLLLTFALLYGSASFSQELVNTTPIELKKNRDVFQTVNNDNKQVTLFVSDKEKVKAIQLNEKMNIIDSISTDRPNPKTYTNMIGYNSTNGNTRLFWSSNDLEQILTQLYDFHSRKVDLQQYTLVLKDENVLQKFTNNEKFYILTVVKKTNTLNLHIFDSEGKYHKQSIDLSHINFYNESGMIGNRSYTKTNIYGIFQKNLLPFEQSFTLQNITTENPTSLTDGAKKRKCYFKGKELIITFDTNIINTQVIIIDLDNYKVTEKIIKKPVIPLSENYSINSNSFYFENKLYQIKNSSKEMYLTIKDLDDNMIKEYFADATNPINFKNTNIHEGKAFSDSDKVFENTPQFIRKVYVLNLGLSCYTIGQNILITFGGVSSPQQSTGQVALGQFGFIGSLIGSFAFNPTMESFNSYSGRKVVKTEGLFDKDGNHIEGNLQPMAFDKIRTFFDKKDDVSSQTLFRMGDFYYLGYYDNGSKEYSIRKFAD